MASRKPSWASISVITPGKSNLPLNRPKRGTCRRRRSASLSAGTRGAGMIDYRILGPLEVSADGRVIEIGGPKLRALLVILLLRANEAVPRDVLVHELWGEQPPDGA